MKLSQVITVLATSLFCAVAWAQDRNSERNGGTELSVVELALVDGWCSRRGVEHPTCGNSPPIGAKGDVFPFPSSYRLVSFAYGTRVPRFYDVSRGARGIMHIAPSGQYIRVYTNPRVEFGAAPIYSNSGKIEDQRWVAHRQTRAFRRDEGLVPKVDQRRRAWTNVMEFSGNRLVVTNPKSKREFREEWERLDP